MQNANPNQELHRHLRILTLLAFIPGFSLLLPYGIVTAKPLPAVGIAPLFFSASSGALVLTGRLRTPGAKAWIDVLLAAFFISVLIPRFVVVMGLCVRITRLMPWFCHSWIAIKKQGNNGWADAGNVMLASYGTAVMMASLYVATKSPTSEIDLTLVMTVQFISTWAYLLSGVATSSYQPLSGNRACVPIVSTINITTEVSP